MLRTLDASKLALTKLRTRKIRLAATIIVAGLLFGIVVFGLTVLRASMASIERFGRNTMSTRYLLAYSNHNKDQSELFYNTPQDAKDRILALHKQHIADKKAAAKALGVEYDEKSEEEPIMKINQDDSGSLNRNSWAVKTFLRQYTDEKNPLKPERIDAAAKRFGSSVTYRIQNVGGRNGSLDVMIGGREDFQRNKEAVPEQLNEFVSAAGYQEILDESLLNYYFLPHRTHAASNEIPVFISYNDAAVLLGKKPLPTTAQPQQHIERIRELRNEAGNITIQVCYRNNASSHLIQQALDQQRTAANKPKNEFDVKPSIEYALPAADSCDGAIVKKDNRSASEKMADEKLQKFNQQFSTENITPQQAKLTYRVVGLLPDTAYGDDLKSKLAGALNANMPSRWIIPKQTFEAGAAKTYLPNILTTERQELSGGLSDTTIYEFIDAEHARAFYHATMCNVQPKDKDLCVDGVSNFTRPFGSNSLVIEELQQQLTPILWYSLLGVIGVAAFILMLTISRTVADSRKESAIFRALGATRLDIAQIYVMYTLLLAGLIALFAIAAGLIGAGVIDVLYSAGFSTAARYIIMPRDLNTTFQLFTFDPLIIALAAVSIVAAALIGSILPLVRNTRRNPMKDMRDE
ncbi:ABC transporter permease [Candidatus Saccharibacteria bacterium]|nr:ABC transporter permease [Candidatus Saccharibacteria bacterium]